MGTGGGNQEGEYKRGCGGEKEREEKGGGKGRGTGRIQADRMVCFWSEAMPGPGQFEQNCCIDAKIVID
jgi:hypothetical protein